MDRDLVLPRPVFRQKAVRREAGGAQRRHVRLAEHALTTMRVERIGRAGPIVDAGIDEFLLEPGEDRQAGGVAQRGDGAAQKPARTALPRLPRRSS